MESRRSVLFALLVAACLGVCAYGRPPTADGNIAGITIAGTLSNEPDPIPATQTAAPIAQAGGECPGKTTKESCEALADCEWDPGGKVMPGGVVTTPMCGPKMGGQAPPPTGGQAGASGVPVRFTLSGISADAPYQANLIISDFSRTELTPETKTFKTAEASAASVSIETSSVVFGMGGQFIATVCLNKTPCPGWGLDCAACKSKQLVVGAAQAVDASGGRVEADVVPPAMRLDEGHFNAVPDWLSNRLQTVTATFTVIETGSRWRASCNLVGMDASNAANDSLCVPGVFDPEVCKTMQPTSVEGLTVKVSFGTNIIREWKPGRYEVQCDLVDDAKNHSPPWARGFQVMTASLATPTVSATPVPAAPVEGLTVTPEASPETALPVPTTKEGLPIPIKASPPAQPTAVGPTAAGAGSACGDAVCQSAEGEDQSSCCADCGCPVGMSCVGGSCAQQGGGAQPPTQPPANTAVVAVIAILVVVGGFYALGLKKE